MKLEIIDYKEDSDFGNVRGGATVTLDLDNQAKEMLINIGFNKLLLDAVTKTQLQEGFSEEDPTAAISDKNEEIMWNLQNYEEWRKDESQTN